MSLRGVVIASSIPNPPSPNTPFPGSLEERFFGETVGVESISQPRLFDNDHNNNTLPIHTNDLADMSHEYMDHGRNSNVNRPLTSEEEFLFQRLKDENDQIDNDVQSFNHIKKDNYEKYDSKTSDFSGFFERFKLQLSCDNMLHLIDPNFVPIALQELSPLSQRKLNNHRPDLRNLHTNVKRKKIEFEKRLLSRFHIILLHVFSENRAQNLLKSFSVHSLPFYKLSQIVKLYNSISLNKEAEAIENFHSINRNENKVIVDYVLRLEAAEQNLQDNFGI